MPITYSDKIEIKNGEAKLPCGNTKLLLRIFNRRMENKDYPIADGLWKMEVTVDDAEIGDFTLTPIIGDGVN